MGKPRCVILGGGGHARLIIDCLKESGAAVPMAVLDSDRALWGKDLLGVPVKGGDDLLAAMAKTKGLRFVVGLGGVGDNGPRARLFALGLSRGLKPLTVIHPSAVLSRSAVVGEGSVLAPGAIVNAAAVLGRNVIVNSGAIVEHDCVVRDHAHVATGAVLASTVRVGAGAHIGAGAVVRQGLTIGEDAVVAAGAAVVKDVAPRSVVGGVPARPLNAIIARRRSSPPDA